jgi:hypothetical protein
LGVSEDEILSLPSLVINDRAILIEVSTGDIFFCVQSQPLFAIDNADQIYSTFLSIGYWGSLFPYSQIVLQ